MPKLGDLVLIRWLDAWGTGKWTDPAELNEDSYPVTSVGWLLQNNKQGVKVHACRADSGNIANITHIPKGMVQTIKTIRAKTK